MGTDLERKDIAVDATWDIETENWTTFVAGGVLTVDGAYQAFDWRREDDFVDYLLSLEGSAWAHNGGAFDDKWLLDHLLRRGIRAHVVAAGSRIVSLQIGKERKDRKKRALRFLDSKALVKMSLREFTAGAEDEKEELGFECVNAEQAPCLPGCEGYCGIRRNMPREKMRRLLDYMETDVRGLMSALYRFKRYALAEDLDLSMTVGASAWSSARRMLGLQSARLSRTDHEFAREGYFGGRVQLFRPRAERGFECDVNSMYPSRLAAFPVPTGDPELVFGGDARRAFNRDAPGIYRAEVVVPDCHLPPLPIRAGTRVCYPTGKFAGTWALPELLHAQEVGVDVKPLRALVFPSSAVLFKPWVDKMFELRTNAPGGKKSPLGTFLKFYLNSLTGKFGARPDNDKLHLSPEEIRCCPGTGNCEDRCSFECGAHRPTGPSPFVFLSSGYRIASCAHVEWAAYLTAEARVEWHRQALSMNDGLDLVYGDTDSIFSLDKRTRNMGAELGQWEDGGAFSNFRGMAPKVYRYERKELVKVRAKGLRLPRMTSKDGKPLLENIARADRAIQSGELVGGEAVVGVWRGASTGKFFEVADVGRRVNEGYGDRILEPGSSFTRAPTVEEALGLDELDADDALDE